MREREPEPKTEDEKRYEALPNNVVRYLDIGKSVRDPRIGEDSRAVLRARQVETMQGFQEGEMEALVGYLTWRQEHVVPDLQAKQQRDLAEYTAWRAQFDLPKSGTIFHTNQEPT